RERMELCRATSKNPYTKNAKTIYDGLNRIKIKIANWLRDEKVNKVDIQQGIQDCLIEAYKQKPIIKGDYLVHQINAYIDSRKHVIEPNTLKRYYVFLRLIQ